MARKETESYATKDEVKKLSDLMIALVFVAILGFVTLLVTVCGLVVTYQHDTQDTYKQSRDATNDQNDKIDSLIQTIREEQKTATSPVQ